MKPEQIELIDLIEGCKKQERKCQQEVYRMLYGKMLAICCRYSRDNDEAKDVLQDGFIKVFEKIEHYNSGGSFEGWVRRIIVNTAIDSYRKKKKEFLIEDEGNIKDQEEWEDHDDESIYDGLTVNDIVECIQHLSPAYRTVFNLYIMEGYSHQEIADEIGISIGTSKSNLAKAKANVKKLLLKKQNGL